VFSTHRQPALTTLAAYVRRGQPSSGDDPRGAGAEPARLHGARALRPDGVPAAHVQNAGRSQGSLPPIESNGRARASSPPATDALSGAVRLVARARHADEISASDDVLESSASTRSRHRARQRMFSREMQIELRGATSSATLRPQPARRSARLPSASSVARARGARRDRPPTPADSYPAGRRSERCSSPADGQAASPNLATLYAGSVAGEKADVVRALARWRRATRRSACSFVSPAPEPRVRSPPRSIWPPPVSTTSPFATSGEAPWSPLRFFATAPLARRRVGETERGAYLFFDMHHSVATARRWAVAHRGAHPILLGPAARAGRVHLLDCAVCGRGRPTVALVAKQKRSTGRETFADGSPRARPCSPEFPLPALSSSRRTGRRSPPRSRSRR